MKSHLSMLALVLFGACAEEQPLPGCPGTHALDAFGVCRARCAADQQCFASEECLDQLCVPRQDAGPVVTLFRVDRSLVESGGSVLIDYAVSFADEVLITAQDSEGTGQVLSSRILVGTTAHGPIARDVELKIVATRGAAFDDEVLTVGVEGDLPVSIASFTANPARIVVGESAELSWQILRGDGTIQLLQETQLLSEDPQAQPFVVQPTLTTEYTLIANGPGGPVQASATVVVDAQPQPLQILTFDAVRANDPQPGDNAALVWTTSGAEHLLLEELGGGMGDRILLDLRDPIRAEGGSWVVLPEAGQRYRLTIEAGGDVKRQVLTLPEAPPLSLPSISRFEVSPLVFEAPQTAQVDWQVSPPDAEVTVRLDGAVVWQAQGSGSLSNLQPRSETATFDLEVRAGGAVERQRKRMFLTVAEQSERNEELALAQPVGAAYLQGDFREINGLNNDEDWYSVASPDGARIRAYADCSVINPNRMMTLELYDSNGTLLQGATAVCPEVNSAPMPQQTHYLRVTATGLLSQFESYAIYVELNQPLCGNGQVEPGEACDDNNGLPKDSCTPDCQDDRSFEMVAQSRGSLAFGPPGTPTSIPLYARPTMPEPRDSGAAALVLPFAFPYRGNRHRGVLVNADGYLSFMPGFSPRPIGPHAPNAVLAPFAADLRIPVVEELKAYESEWDGVAAVVIDFGHLQFVDGPGSDVSARVGLLADGRVLFRYGALTGQGQLVQAAIEDSTGHGEVPVPGCEARLTMCPLEALPQSTLIEFTPAPSVGGN